MNLFISFNLPNFRKHRNMVLRDDGTVPTFNDHHLHSPPSSRKSNNSVVLRTAGIHLCATGMDPLLGGWPWLSCCRWPFAIIWNWGIDI